MMSSSGFLPTLNLGTLLIVFLVVALALIYFLRKRSNQHPMDGRRERNVAEDIDKGRKPRDQFRH